MDNNGIGVHTVSATANIIKNCVIEGGAIRVLLSSWSGNRASYNTLGKPSKPALTTDSHSAHYFDNNLIAKGSASLGPLMTGVTDRYRFRNVRWLPSRPCSVRRDQPGCRKPVKSFEWPNQVRHNHGFLANRLILDPWSDSSLFAFSDLVVPLPCHPSC
jgi:hypothetical protein